MKSEDLLLGILFSIAGIALCFLFTRLFNSFPEPEITPTRQATIVDIGHYVVPDGWASTSVCFLKLDNGESYKFADYYAPELTAAKSGDTVLYFTEEGRFCFVRYYKQGEPVMTLPWEKSKCDTIPKFPQLN